VRGIRQSLATAAEHLPRIDAIGVSSAGIYVDNQTRVASLFRLVSEADFEREVKDIYIDLARSLGAPLVVANDGDVTALAGFMSLGQSPLLGLALGTSLAAGYVDARGRITGWFNELAFAPVDYAKRAAIDTEWSNDQGVGSTYLSQDGAIRLARRAGLELPSESAPAEQLACIQQAMQRGDERCRDVFESLGVYLGYALLHYSEFYDVRHVLLLGRVTSGPGGALLSQAARQVVEAEAEPWQRGIELHLPDEASRRVGQSVAAASLPEVSSRP
jgi:predicted NBD/HSP70 family sugar kinase